MKIISLLAAILLITHQGSLHANPHSWRAVGIAGMVVSGINSIVHQVKLHELAAEGIEQRTWFLFTNNSANLNREIIKQALILGVSTYITYHNHKLIQKDATQKK